MTSTLFVEEIKGRTTGTNANKVIVPSGQKLEAHTLSGTSTVEAGAKIAGADTGSLTAPGMFINAVSASKTDSQANATNDSFTDISGLSVTITPKSTSSKILLLCNISLSGGDDATGRAFKVLRGSTPVGVGSEGSRTPVSFFGSPMSGDTNMAGTTSWHYLDSPNTTSAITYKVQMTGFNTGVTTYINTNISRGGQAYDDIASSNFTAIEIAG